MNETIPAKFRDIGIITQEIIFLREQTQRQVLDSFVEIGRRLCEAKELLNHGEWGKWLSDEVSFSQSSANNLMRIYREYGDPQGSLFGAKSNSQTLGNLSYTKALALLAVPENEREEFAKEHDAEHLSTRELEKAIRERDDAKRALGDAQIALDKTKDELSAARAAEKQATERMREAQKDVKAADDQAQANENALKSQLENAEKELKAAKEAAQKAKDAEKKAKDKLKAAVSNPEIPPEKLDELKKEAEAAAAEKSKETEKRLSAAEARVDELKKQLQLSDPDTAIFKTYFGEFQECFNKMCGALLKIETNDPDKAVKLKTAINKTLDSMTSRI